MSIENEQAAKSLWASIVGVAFAALGALFIWGIGGVLLVFGTYIATMSAIEYWKSQ